ncbi:MAG TPA: hypothetical protein EYG78_07640 [Sulfurovum sp.]|nr:hypothetical protein [Sulfurovum sp.]
MNKLLLTTLLIGSVVTLSNAAEKYDTKAFRIITKLCTPCHGTPFYMAKQVDGDDWEFFFKKEKTMLKIHKGEPKGLTSLKSSLFKSKKKRIKKFLVNNSKYSGKVHGCDANFCGTHH